MWGNGAGEGMPGQKGRLKPSITYVDVRIFVCRR